MGKLITLCNYKAIFAPDPYEITLICKIQDFLHYWVG